MTATTSAPRPAGGKNYKKFTMQLIVGMIVGAGAASLAFNFADDLRADRLAADEVAALGVGVVYAIMGLFVALGVLFPKPGSKMLNVADEADLHDQRPMLISSAIGCLLIGIAMLILVAASPAFALISRLSAAVLFGLCLLLSVATTMITKRYLDGFANRLHRDSAVAGLLLITSVFGFWAVLAHLGFVPMFSALTFVSGVLALYLLAVFYVVGKRGLLVPDQQANA